jgi:site-specific recombinase XerD
MIFCQEGMVLMHNDKLDPLIEGYLDYLGQVRRQTPRTIVDVRCTLRRVCAAMLKLQPDRTLWQFTLAEYIKWLEQERQQGRSPSCLSKYLCHIRGLLDYAWRSGRCDRNVLDGFNLQDDLPRKAPEVLTIEEARRLVECCPQDTFTQRQERLIILILYGCGLRTAELCDLSISDVNRERGELFVRKGKGDIQRVVPIPPGVQSELWAYLLDRGGKRGPLFLTDHKHKRISASRICEIVTAASQRAGIHWKVTARTLRHSYATHLMDRGVDLAIIASLMGHRSPAETGVYLHVLKDRPRQAVSKLMNNKKESVE